MHIEAYEWALYLKGALSERRMSEIEASVLLLLKAMLLSS